MADAIGVARAGTVIARAMSAITARVLMATVTVGTIVGIMARIMAATIMVRAIITIIGRKSPRAPTGALKRRYD